MRQIRNLINNQDIQGVKKMAGHGGVRAGAGRKKGSANRATQEMLKRAKASGQLPLEYLLDVMRDVTQDVRLRIDAAKFAAPYVHNRLSAIEVHTAVQEMTHEEWVTTLR